jgi:hypothetical protein
MDIQKLFARETENVVVNDIVPQARRLNVTFVTTNGRNSIMYLRHDYARVLASIFAFCGFLSGGLFMSLIILVL